VTVSLIRSYAASPVEAFDAALAATERLGLPVSMIDTGNRDFVVTAGSWPRHRGRLTISVTDNALGGVCVHVAAQPARGFFVARAARRFLRALDRLLPHRRLRNPAG
jgi:hypothetical protein